jgi:hypothetical protein
MSNQIKRTTRSSSKNVSNDDVTNKSILNVTLNSKRSSSLTSLKVRKAVKTSSGREIGYLQLNN